MRCINGNDCQVMYQTLLTAGKDKRRYDRLEFRKPDSDTPIYIYFDITKPFNNTAGNLSNVRLYEKLWKINFYIGCNGSE